MDRRRLGAGFAAFASGLLLLAGNASAQVKPRTEGAPAGQCTIKTLPSFVAQGEYGTTASVADVIEIGCNPEEYGTGSKISVMDPQLYSRCKNLTWIDPNPLWEEWGRGITLTLDADGNATVALIAGPDCQAGETLITVHELEEPFESFDTGFTVLPPNETPKGVETLPASQIEDSESSSVVTIVEAEFPGASEDKVRFGSEEFNARCRGGEGAEEGEYPPGLLWVTESGKTTYGSEINGLELDDDGNVFALAIGDSSCYPGTSLIEADLESKPFTTLTTGFTIVAPTPRD